MSVGLERNDARRLSFLLLCSCQIIFKVLNIICMATSIKCLILFVYLNLFNVCACVCLFPSIGESGLGKSTLINSLFLTDLYSKDYPGPSQRIKKTVQVRPISDSFCTTHDFKRVHVL